MAAPVTVRSNTPRVRLVCHKPYVNRTPMLIDAKLTDGIGGWETVTRPRQTAMTVWTGSPPFQLALHVLFDEYGPIRIGENADVEHRIAEILRAGRGAGSEPSTWRIDGLPMMFDTVKEWVLNTAEPGDVVLRRPSDYRRVRQEYTLTFLEYVPPKYLKLASKALAGPGPSTMYKVKKNETPAGIARRRHIQWTVLRLLNPKTVKTANQKLKTGLRIRVPVVKQSPKKTTNKR